MRKFVFGISIIAMIAISSFGLFSKNYKARIVENKISFSPTLGSLVQTMIFEIIFLILLFLYLNCYVGYNLAFGYVVLEIVSCIVANTYLYTNILTDQSFFILDKIITIIEILMLVKIGYVGLHH